jgi:hypothetical protein
MKAEELRIGNCVYNGFNEVIKISSIISQNNTSGYLLETLKPIPLTKEILLKCGAEKYEFDNGQPNQYRVGSRLFVIRNGAIYDYGSDTKLNYLHELQNLYYSLTKTELNYENTNSKN